MKRKVTYAKLQNTDAFIPGLGALGSTLPSPNRTLKLSMEWDREGQVLIVTVNGKQAIIPMTNVQIAVLAPQEESVSAVA